MCTFLLYMDKYDDRVSLYADDYSELVGYLSNILQYHTKYLRPTLVFMWNSAEREKFSFNFLRVFC